MSEETSTKAGKTVNLTLVGHAALTLLRKRYGVRTRDEAMLKFIAAHDPTLIKNAETFVEKSAELEQAVTSEAS